MKLDNILSEIIIKNHSAFFYTPSYYKKSKSYLFQDPSEIISIKKDNDIQKLFKKIDNNISKGLWCYALINYESGYLFEEKLKKHLTGNNEVLIQFIFFKEKNVEVIPSKEILISNDLGNYKIKNFKLDTSKRKFTKDINKIKKFIEEGDTYQVNYTLKGKFNFSGNVENLFQTLIFNQSASYSAFINHDYKIFLSLSPELFFEVNGNIITTKPMKGTARRGHDIASDHYNKYNLENDEKNKAENLMIVDLLRNDLGKISNYGKVKVSNLFEIEKYESLYQMISTVTATLNRNISLTEIIKNVFPCGSITGAPKIRTMEIINQLEQKTRGIYTGAIGISNKKFSSFNVAIRTISIDKKTLEGEMGLGSGIVWDSIPEKEFEETLLKSKFIRKPNPYFEIYETMLVKNGKVFLLEEHIERLRSSAEYFLFKFDKKNILNEIINQLRRLEKNKDYRYKLILNKWGKLSSVITQYIEDISEKKIIISNKLVNSQNPFQYFKTTNRNLYERELKKYMSKGFFDVIFFNEKNQLTEGARTNIFIKRNGGWYTPSLNSGILSGVYRKYMLQKERNIKEDFITKDDFLSAEEILLTNSLRGKIKISKLFLNENEYNEFM